MIERDNIDVYDPGADQWASITTMTTTRGSHAVVVFGKNIYVLGGTNSTGYLDSVEMYIPSLETK